MRFGNILFSGLISSALILYVAAPASATAYVEGADLSNSQAAPTPLPLTPGANSVTGTVGGAETQDWVAFIVPGGFQMDNYVNSAYAGPDAQGFTGFQFGPSFVGSPFAAGSYAGYAHFGPGATNPGVAGGGPSSTVGVDILPVPYMADNSGGGTAAGATGFAPPLAAGTYTFLIQQLGANVSYSFTMNVSAVPEPTTLGLLVPASLLFVRRRRAR